MDTDISSGTRIGRYEIQSKLGAGGMGEVYLAQDTQLERTVALKVLPPNVAQDRRRMRRFIQEAKAASALNHPNILTIHEIGEENGLNFIATEFIDGCTLRERVSEGALKTNETLDVAMQVASALSAAHHAGVIHRDIKPENIMLREDGYVKVLDFGLAKLTQQPPPAVVDTDAATKSLFKTDAGAVLGTVAYMSPEQARGLEVDARTDIWSLGVVIYEMVAGRRPFAGASTGEMFASILSEKEQRPLTHFTQEAPPELDRILAKALRKDREARYQTISDLLADLKNLKASLDFEAKLGQAASSQRPEGVRSGGQEAIETVIKPIARPTFSPARLPATVVRHKKLVAVASLAVLVALAVVPAGYFYFSRGSQASSDSIAILPFVNTTADPETEYLSDGLTESIINSLSQISQLKVMARSTVFRYKGPDTDPRKVGRELGVQTVLTGKVQQRGDTLSIQAELVDVATGLQLWGEQYNRRLSDLLSMQAEISKEISEKLSARLTGEEQRRVTKSYTENVDAYRLYLKGRFEWNKFSPEGIKNSIEFYNQAIGVDPTYALAYVGLSQSYGLQGHLMVPPREGYSKAKWAVEKALELDGTLAEAHNAMASVSLFYEWDWPAVERELQRSRELNPKSAGASLIYPAYLKTMGRFGESVAAAKRAQEFDPLSPFTASELAEAHYFSRQYDEAITQGAKALEIDPRFRLAYHVRGRAFAQKGMYREAVAELQKWAENNRAPQAIGSLGQVYGMSGQRDKAMETLAELDRISKERYVQSYWRAIVYVGLNDKDQAFYWLEKAYEERYFLLIWIGGDPRFDPLRSDPRFADLLRRMKLA